MISANKSKAYTSFIHQRDKALSRMHEVTMQKINDELRHAFTQAMATANYLYSHIPAKDLLTPNARSVIMNIDFSIQHEFDRASQDITKITQKLMRLSYLLASMGEAKAIINATGKKTKLHITKQQLDEHAKTNFQGENVHDRILFGFNRIRRDLIDSLERSRVQGLDHKEAMAKAVRALPGSRRVRQPKRLLRKITEADKDIVLDADVEAFIPEDEWNELVDLYEQDFVPNWRGPENVYDITPAGEPEDYTEEWYAWEIENQINQDFVDSVRSGQNDAANQNGINDMVWIAIVDDKTDECCLWRDGLTSSEIEEKLQEHGDDDCDGATVPPGHFNCRCTMAPMIDAMPDMPASNEEDFNTWLRN